MNEKNSSLDFLKHKNILIPVKKFIKTTNVKKFRHFTIVILTTKQKCMDYGVLYSIYHC